MKTSYLFVAALLLTALASCSRIQTEGGTKTLKDGTVYAGCTDAQGRPHGYGQLTKGDSTLYEGQWNHGIRAGKGTVTDSTGTRIVGT